MAQSKEFADASHALNDLSRALALLEAENARLRKELEAGGTAAYLHGGDQLKAENFKLRELVRELYANLCNRETILELMGMPPSVAAKAAVKGIIDKCSELGIEVEQ